MRGDPLRNPVTFCVCVVFLLPVFMLLYLCASNGHNHVPKMFFHEESVIFNHLLPEREVCSQTAFHARRKCPGRVLSQ